MPQPSARQFSGIFISYRREDTSGHAGRLCDNLVERFGKDRIFMDIDTIEPGEDFIQVIENAVGSCDILIAVIGRHWLGSDAQNQHGVNKPNDFVRVEVAAALNRDIRVIPVLVQKASMPSPQDLPDDLVKLTRRNAVELTDLHWQRDVEELISVLERVLDKQEAARQKTVAEARQQKSAEETRRVEGVQSGEVEFQRREDEKRLQGPIQRETSTPFELGQTSSSSAAKKLYLFLGAIIIIGLITGTSVYLIRINGAGTGPQSNDQGQSSVSPTPQSTQEPRTNNNAQTGATNDSRNHNNSNGTNENQNRITVSNTNFRITNTHEAERQQNANLAIEEKQRQQNANRAIEEKQRQQNANRALEELQRRQRAINAMTNNPTNRPTPYKVP